MNSGNVPKHLEVAARTGFISVTNELSRLAPYSRFVREHTMTAASENLVDLGSAPMPTEETDQPIRDFIEKNIDLDPKNWTTTVWLSWNAFKDDQTGSLQPKVRSAGEQFVRHINNRAFQFLNGGDGNTYGLCYDGEFYFDNDHTDDGAFYQTNQDNLYALALNPTNFNTVWSAAKLFRDDQGEFMNLDYDLIVTDPTTMDAATQIAKNPNKAGTGNNDLNPFEGDLQVLTSPHMDAGAWVVLSTGGTAKPLILGMRERPHLQHTWFDPQAPDGGRFYFKYYARYNFVYGDWRLGIMGKT